ncbi:MAG: hypothetical protein M3174_04875, partial [Actinomycetota bacterium]|nr:hypothetical protein [Actinomycetota bacterium]
SGPLIGTRELPEGDAELTGAMQTAGEAVVDLDDGLLRTARSFTTYDWDVNVVPQDAANPVTGTLQLEQDLTLTKISEEAPE